MNRHKRDRRLKQHEQTRRPRPRPGIGLPHAGNQNRGRMPPASPWALHELLDFSSLSIWSRRGTAAAPPDGRLFHGTREVVAYGVQLGLGKATQEQAIQALRERFPEHAPLFDDPVFLAGLKLALPLLGIQLANHIRDPRISGKLLDASQSMLLVNTIDVTADVTAFLLENLAEVSQIFLAACAADGLAPQETQQLAADLGLQSLVSRSALRQEG